MLANPSDVAVKRLDKLEEFYRPFGLIAEEE
jgi:hypothetical protein